MIHAVRGGVRGEWNDTMDAATPCVVRRLGTGTSLHMTKLASVSGGAVTKMRPPGRAATWEEGLKFKRDFKRVLTIQ